MGLHKSHEIQARAVARIRTCDLLSRAHLSYHLTYTAAVIKREILKITRGGPFSTWW